MNDRWYDKHPIANDVFGLLKTMDKPSRAKLSNDIIAIANQIKSIHKDDEEQSLSIGLERVLGLYKSSNGRRWYDRSSELNHAIRTISTLPQDDYLNIMEGISVSYSD